MKWSLLIIGALAIVGCGEEEIKPQANAHVPRKEWKDMNQDEKIEFINRTPMPQSTKDKEIARIKAGQN